MNEAIRVGDVVQLRSGGRMFTVAELPGDNFAVCVWWCDASHSIRFDRIPAVALRVVDKPKRGEA